MNIASSRRIPISSFLLLLIGISCGGTGSGGPSSGGGVGGTGISYGKITGFGSVFVNGIEFDTTNASVTLDGSAGGESDLSIGMVVTVRGEIGSDRITGTADSIDFDDNVEGPIDSLDVALKTFTILGITVSVNDETLFIDATDITSLAVGNVVEVSGFVDANGTVNATLVKWKSAAFEPGHGEMELKGIIANLDEEAETFTLGNLTVDYSGAELEHLPSGGLADGLFVEVKSEEGLSPDGLLIASKVQGVESSLADEEGDELELEGFVTAVFSPTEFELNGQPVLVSSQTEFENGTAGDIGLNVHLEVGGRLDGSGVLIAEEIEFHDSGDDGEGDDNGDDLSQEDDG